jgi:hypothetical protein
MSAFILLFTHPHMTRRDTSHRILSTVSQPQPEPAEEEIASKFTQFARIDQGFLAWHFNLVDARKEVIASVDRAFRGFGREVSDCQCYIWTWLLTGFERSSQILVFEIHLRGQVSSIDGTQGNISFDSDRSLPVLKM